MDFIKAHPYLSAFGAIGGLEVAKIGWNIIYTLYQNISLKKDDFFSRYGPGWAIVTGATGGIGMAYCWELASRNFNVLMVGRNTEILTKARESLQKHFPKIGVDIITIDFEKGRERDWVESFENSIKDREIALLVNTAGTASNMTYDLYPTDKMEEIIKVNLYGTFLLTRLVVPRMLDRSEVSKRSGIINISSLCANGKYPTLSIYCATKAFMDAASLSLHNELKSKIDVVSIQCGAVLTKLSPVKSFWTLLPHDAARKHMQCLGVHAITHGCWKHYLQEKYFETWPFTIQKRKFLNMYCEYWRKIFFPEKK